MRIRSERPTYVEDGSQWYNYFSIRQNSMGYYIAWRGKPVPAFSMFYETVHEAREFIMKANWREVVDEAFEKEVLGE